MRLSYISMMNCLAFPTAGFDQSVIAALGSVSPPESVRLTLIVLVSA